MRIAFVYIPRFCSAVEMLRNPDLGRQPLIVGDAEQPKHVLDCSSSAGLRHVQPGMPIRKALGLCPEAAVIPPDPVLYKSSWEAVLDALGEIVPEVEDEEIGRAYLNVTGLQHHYRDESHLGECIIRAVKEASGLTASAGIAAGKFPALAAASVAPAGEAQIVPAGSEAAVLAPASIDLLPVDPEIIFRLRLLGLEQMGDVASFSIPELQSQFGFEGKLLWQLANGIDDGRLKPRKPADKLQAGLKLEAAIAGIDVMIAIARQLLSRLRPQLKGRAARELTLQAELASGRGWEHRLVFREAVSEDERLAFLLRSALTNFPPPQAIRSLTLRLGSLTGETGKQLSLGHRARRRRQLEDAVRQLKARYGYSPVYRCVDVEPWSAVPEERQILVESDV